jgi:ASC-1-like (ASCH) protein
MNKISRLKKVTIAEDKLEADSKKVCEKMKGYDKLKIANMLAEKVVDELFPDSPERDELIDTAVDMYLNN